MSKPLSQETDTYKNIQKHIRRLNYIDSFIHLFPVNLHFNQAPVMDFRWEVCLAWARGPTICWARTPVSSDMASWKFQYVKGAFHGKIFSKMVEFFHSCGSLLEGKKMKIARCFDETMHQIDP